MSLPVTSRIAGPYSCNGVLVTFSFAFKVFETSNIQVIHTTAAAAETTLALTTNYTVSLNADQEANPGGTITTVSTYVTGEKITILGALAYGQPTVLTNLGAFFPKVIEYAMDRLGILIQQVKEQLDRAVRMPASSGASGELPAPAAGLVLGWNAAANGLVNLASPGALTVSPFVMTVLDDTTAAAVLATLGAAASGANTDITSLGSLALVGFTTTGDIILSGNAAIEEARANIAMHATTMDLWAGPNVLDGTSTAATLTAIANAPQAGARRTLYPVANSIITNGATFAVDGAANHTAAAGDKWEFEAITTSTYKVHVTKKDGTAVVAPTGGFVKSVFSQSGAMVTGVYAIPNDDTIPQVSEGVEVFSVGITPASTTNKLLVKAVVYGAGSADGRILTALFRDGAANAVAAAYNNEAGTSAVDAVTLMYEVVAGSVSATTFTLRVGTPSGTLTVNGQDGARKLGGVLNSYIEVIEVSA